MPVVSQELDFNTHTYGVNFIFITYTSDEQHFQHKGQFENLKFLWGHKSSDNMASYIFNKILH
jgi:hypothetical protein